MNRLSTKPLVLTVVLLAACGSGISGRYSDAQGLTTYEFHRDGSAIVTVLGTSVAANYTIDGERVLINSPQGTIVLTQKEDQLFGPSGLKLTKNKREKSQ